MCPATFNRSGAEHKLRTRKTRPKCNKKGTYISLACEFVVYFPTLSVSRLYRRVRLRKITEHLRIAGVPAEIRN
jgi:hypothetical protein